jgi:hypothetical protein
MKETASFQSSVLERSKLLSPVLSFSAGPISFFQPCNIPGAVKKLPEYFDTDSSVHRESVPLGQSVTGSGSASDRQGQ